MKLWQILKAENEGKKFKSDAGVIYTLKVDTDGVPMLMNDRNMALPFTQREVFSLNFTELKEFTGWERVTEGDSYYYIDYAAKIEMEQDDDSGLDEIRHRVHNYFSTLGKAQEIRNAQELYSKMKKFCDINGGQVDWTNNKYKYFVYFNHEIAAWEVGAYTKHEIPNVVYFNSYDLAKKCIDEVIKPLNKGE